VLEVALAIVILAEIRMDPDHDQGKIFLKDSLFIIAISIDSQQ